MKRALLHILEPGRICQVVNPGEEFEVHENFQWIDVPDDTTSNDTWDFQTNTVIKFDPTQLPGFAEHGYRVARTIGYGGIGDQLDMLYRELRDTGTISTDGQWFQHINNIKSAIPKDDPQAVYEWNQQYYAATTGNV